MASSWMVVLSFFLDPGCLFRKQNLATVIFLLLACGSAAVPAKGQGCAFLVSQSSIDFGMVVPDRSVSRMFTVTPQGGNISFILAITQPQDYRWYSVSPASKMSASAFQVTVTFRPEFFIGMLWQATLNINGGVCGSQAVNLSGESFGGSVGVNPTQLDFGTVAVGQSKTLPFAAIGFDQRFSPVEVTVASNNPAVSVNPATFQIVASLDSKQVTVTYAPTAIGSLAAEVSFKKMKFVATNYSFPSTAPPVTIKGNGFGVSTTSLPDGGIRCGYGAQLVAGGGRTPYTWSVASGSLPTGLSLDAVTGLISGTAMTGGRSNFSVRATEDQGVSHTRNLSILVGPPKPSISTAGFLDAAGSDQPPSVGGLGSIYGSFCVQTGNAGQIPLPTEINKTRLLLGPPSASVLPPGNNAVANLIPVPLLFVSDKQINFQIPWELASSAPGLLKAVVEADGIASDPVQVPIARNTPSLFAFDFQRPAKGIVLNLDFTAAQPVGSIPGYPCRPARTGEVIILYATGLGLVDPAGETGGLGDAGTLHNTIVKPIVRVGGIPAIVSFSGLSPNFVGLYQVNAILGPTTPVGNDVPITIEIGGKQSATNLTMAVRRP